MRSTDERLRDLLAKPGPKKKARSKKVRRKKDDYLIDITRLDELCETELVAVAKLIGHAHASRALLKEDLVSLILGDLESPEDPLMDPREKLYAHVKANESIMRSFMPCDLHCPTCPHRRLAACFTTNRDLVE